MSHMQAAIVSATAGGGMALSDDEFGDIEDIEFESVNDQVADNMNPEEPFEESTYEDLEEGGGKKDEAEEEEADDEGYF